MSEADPITLARHRLESFDIPFRWASGGDPGVDLVGQGSVRGFRRQRVFVQVKRLRGPNRLENLQGAAARGALELASAPDNIHKLVVILVDKLGRSAVRTVTDYLGHHAPDVGWAVCDLEGAGELHLPKLGIDAATWPDHTSRGSTRKHDPFSDLGTWLIKLLLLRGAPTWAWSGPRTQPRTVSELGALGEVSGATAHRFAKAMKAAGYLVQTPRGLDLVRVPVLLERLRASYRSRAPVLSAVSSVFGDGADVIARAVQTDGVLGGQLAAAHFGLKHAVAGRKLIWFQTEVLEALRRFDLSFDDGRTATLWVGHAKSGSALERGCVTEDVRRFVDPCQLMLESALDPKRGLEQSDYLIERLHGWWEDARG